MKYGQKTNKTKDICTIDKATGSKKVPKCPGGIPLIDFLGFQRDHVVLELLETKNDRNLGYFYAFWLFLRGFLTLTPL